MQRLIEYIARCPFSLTRMVSLDKDGKIIYRTTHPNCLPFPLSGDKTLMKGIPRNFEVYDQLDFLAEVTQHIPNKGEHQFWYYGWYSNKKRGLHLKKVPRDEQVPGLDEPDTPYRRKCRMTWTALINCVFEVDPLKCPYCGGTMRIVSFIDEDSVIRKILKHCNLLAKPEPIGEGWWKEPVERAPPKLPQSADVPTGTTYDTEFLNTLVG